jgi:hypothetical protein
MDFRCPISTFGASRSLGKGLFEALDAALELVGWGRVLWLAGGGFWKMGGDDAKHDGIWAG